MKWFINTFLKSFKAGETKISEKQYRIFEKYLKHESKDGYISGYMDEIEGFKIKAYEWASISGIKYYVDITEKGRA